MGMEEKKFDDLLNAWWNVDTYVASSGFCSSGLLTWLQEHTLRVVLSETWSTRAGEARGDLQRFLRRLQDHLPQGHPERDKLQALARLADDPWGDPLLRNILVRHVPPDDPQVAALLARESASVALARAGALAEARCEDLALALLDACLRCAERARDAAGRWAASQEQLLELYDARIMLWHHFERLDDIIRFLQGLSAEEGAAVVLRLLAKDGAWRLWREREGAARCVFQWLLTSALALEPLAAARRRLCALVTLWPRAAQLRNYDLLADLRKMLGPARSAYHVFALAQTLTQQLGGTCRALCIELYIRGITTQMNDLAHAKSQQLLMSIKDVEFRLSTSLMELADLLRQDVSVWRECILTAFSLNPTRECFGQVESAAVESYKRLQAPTSMEVRFSRVTVTDVYATAGRCGSVDVLLDPRSVLDAGALGLSPALCDDLAVILRCLRYQALQWSLEWGELKRRCIRYMEDIKERINSPSELRFLKIDFDNLRNSSCEDVRSFFGINGTSPQWNENADESCVQMIERSYKQVYPDEKMEIVFQEVKRTSTSRLSSPMSEVTTHTAVGVHVSQSQSLLVRAQRDPVDETTREGSSEDEWQDTKNKKRHAHEKKHRGARGSNKKSCVKIDRSVKRKVVGMKEETIVEDSFTEVTSLEEEPDVRFAQTIAKTETEMEDSTLSWLFQDDVNLNSIIENIPNGVEADQELQSAMEYFDLECTPMDDIATLPHTFPADATETSLKKDLEKSLPIFHNTQMESIAGNEVDASLHPHDQKTEYEKPLPVISDRPDSQLIELGDYLENRTLVENVCGSVITSSSCIKKRKKRRKARKTWDIRKRKSQSKGKPSRCSQRFSNLNTTEPHILNGEKSVVGNRRSLSKTHVKDTYANEETILQETEMPSQARRRRPRWDSVLLNQCYKQRVRSITCRKLHFLKENGDIDCDCPEQEKKSSKSFETSSREEMYVEKKKGRKAKRRNADESETAATVDLPECCDPLSSDSFIMQSRSLTIDTPENNCGRENFMKVNLEQACNYSTPNLGTPQDTLITSFREMKSPKRTKGLKQKTPNSDSYQKVPSVQLLNEAECIFPAVVESSFFDNDTENKNEESHSMNVNKERDNISYEKKIGTILSVSNTSCQVINVPTMKIEMMKKTTFTNTPKKTLNSNANNGYCTDSNVAGTLSFIQENPVPVNNGEIDIFSLEQHSRAMDNQAIETPTRKGEKKTTQSNYIKRGRKQKGLGDGSLTRSQEDAIHESNSDSPIVTGDIEPENEKRPSQLLANENTPKDFNSTQQKVPTLLGIFNALEITPTINAAKKIKSPCTSAIEPITELSNVANSAEREHGTRLLETSGEMQHLMFENGATGDVHLKQTSEYLCSSIGDVVTSTKKRTKEDAPNITSRDPSRENETEQKPNDFTDSLILLPVEDVQENLHTDNVLDTSEVSGLECDSLKLNPAATFCTSIPQETQTPKKKRGRKPKVVDSAFLTPACIKESQYDEEVLSSNENTRMEKGVLERNAPAIICAAISQETQTPTKKRGRKPKVVDSDFLSPIVYKKESKCNEKEFRNSAEAGMECDVLEQNTPAHFCDKFRQKVETTTKKRGRKPKVLDSAFLTPAYIKESWVDKEVLRANGSSGMESGVLEQNSTAFFCAAIPQETLTPTKKRGGKPKAVDSTFSAPAGDVKESLYVENVFGLIANPGMECDVLEQNTPARFCDTVPPEKEITTKKRGKKTKAVDFTLLTPAGDESESSNNEVLASFGNAETECDSLERRPPTCVRNTISLDIQTPTKKRGRKPKIIDSAILAPAAYVRVDKMFETRGETGIESDCLKLSPPVCDMFPQEIQTPTKKRVRKRKVFDSEFLAPSAYEADFSQVEVLATSGKTGMESDGLDQMAPFCKTMSQPITSKKKRGRKPNASFVVHSQDVQETPHVEQVLGTCGNHGTKCNGAEQTHFSHTIPQEIQTTTNKRVRRRKVFDSDFLSPAYIQGNPHTQLPDTCRTIENESEEVRQNSPAHIFNTIPQHAQTFTKKRGRKPKVVEFAFSVPTGNEIPKKRPGRKPKVLDGRCKILSTIRTTKKIISDCQIVGNKSCAVQREETTTNKTKKVHILIPETFPPFQFANQSNSHNREVKSVTDHVFSSKNSENPPLKSKCNEEIYRLNFQDKSALGSTNMCYSEMKTTTNKNPIIDKMFNSGKVHNEEIENKMDSIAPVTDDNLDVPKASKGNKDDPSNIIQIGLSEACKDNRTEPVQKVVNASAPQPALTFTLKHIKSAGQSLNILVLGECSKANSLSKSHVRKITLHHPADQANHKRETSPKQHLVQTSQESSICVQTSKMSTKSQDFEKTNQVPISKSDFSAPILLPLTFSDGSVRNYIVQRNIQPQTKHSVDDAPNRSNVLIIGNSLQNQNSESTPNSVFRGISHIPVVLWDVSQNVISTSQTPSQSPALASKSVLKPPLTVKFSKHHPVCISKPSIYASCPSIVPTALPSAETHQLSMENSQKSYHTSPQIPTVPPKSSHQPGELSSGPTQIRQVNLNSLRQTPTAPCEHLKQSGLIIKPLSYTSALSTNSPQVVCKMSTAHSQNNKHPTTNMLGQKLQLHTSERSSEPTAKMPLQHSVLLTSQQYSNDLQHPPGLSPKPSQQCSVLLESSKVFHKSSPNATKLTELCSDSCKPTSMQILMLNTRGLKQSSELSSNNLNSQSVMSSKTLQPPSGLYSNTSYEHSSKSLPPTSGRTLMPSPKHGGLCQTHSQQPYVLPSNSSPHTNCSGTSLRQPLTLIANTSQQTQTKTSHQPREQFSNASQQLYILTSENSQKHSASSASLHPSSVYQQSLKLPTVSSMSSQQVREVTLNDLGQCSEGTSKNAHHLTGLMPLHLHQPCQHSGVALQQPTMPTKSPQLPRELCPKEMCKVATTQQASMESTELLKQTSVLITKPSSQSTPKNSPKIIELPQTNKLATNRLYWSSSEGREVPQPSGAPVRPLQPQGGVERGALSQQQPREMSPERSAQGSAAPPLHCVVFSLPRRGGRDGEDSGAALRRGADLDPRRNHRGTPQHHQTSQGVQELQMDP